MVRQKVKTVTIEDQTSSLLKVRDIEQYHPWSPDPTIKSTLEFYADSGDIQTCVTMYLVLGHERLKKMFADEVIEYWFKSYIELLQRFRLIYVAIHVSKVVGVTLHCCHYGCGLDHQCVS